jgi:hypothetical protein
MIAIGKHNNLLHYRNNYENKKDLSKLGGRICTIKLFTVVIHSVS